MDRNAKTRQSKSLIVAFTVYVLVSILMLFVHEPWRDEAQVWLLVRDLSFWDLVLQMRYEGTPGLWHFFLFPFVKSGLPYITESVLHHLVAVVIVALFFLKAPFSNRFKILFAFSYYMLFEYSAIVRHYGLSILLLFLTAHLYGARFKRPLLFGLVVFLLANSSLQMLFMAALLGFLYLIEVIKQRYFTKEHLTALLFMVLGGISAAFQIVVPKDCVFVGVCSYFDVAFPFFSFQASLFPFYLHRNDLLAAASLFIFFSLFVYLFYQRRSAAFLYAASSTIVVYLISCRFFGSHRHWGLYIIFALFALWITEKSSSKKTGKLTLFNFDFVPLCKKIGYAGLEISFFLSFFLAAWLIFNDIRYPFSGSKEMAGYIQENLEGKSIAAFPWARNTALLPYLPDRKFWYATLEKEGTFATWTEKHWDEEEISSDEVFRRIENAFFGQEKPYMLLSRQLTDPDKYGYYLEYSVAENIFTFPLWDEMYYLYAPIEYGQDPDAKTQTF